MVFTSGAFDGLHAGHVLYLEAAKALCDRDELLVCAVAPDSYIEQTKGRSPYWHQHDRHRTVNALGCVDAAIPQQHQSVADLIRDYRPRLFVKGPDWEGRLPKDVQRACEDVGTDIGYVDTPGTHVSQIRISDETALERFEQLVVSQTPAETPWEPVTDYSFDARKEIEGKHPELIEAVFQAARIVDAGMGPGHLVRLLREQRGDPVVMSGWTDTNTFAAFRDAFAASARWVVGFDSQRDDWCYGNVTAPSCAWALFRPQMADLVICREVLEHLTIQQIRRAVTNLCRLAAKYVYGTTRFHPAPTHILDVATHDDLDPTHITLATKPFLKMLFALEGFRWRGDLAETMDWRGYGRTFVFERAS